MSPNGQSRRVNASNNLYTVILALAFLAVLGTLAFVAYKCQMEYGTIFKIP
jgi:hypothetical protein